MFFSRAVLCVVLICAVGLILGANSHRRKVRSPFTLEIQKAVEKAAKEQVRVAAVVGRAMKILPPKADNETRDEFGEGNSTSATHDSNPLAFFETIPLKFVSVVKGKQDETTTEIAEATTTKPPAGATVVKLAEAEDEGIAEVLPQSEALKASGTKQSEDVKSQAESELSPAKESKIFAAADSVAEVAEPDSVATDPVEDEEDAEDEEDPGDKKADEGDVAV